MLQTWCFDVSEISVGTTDGQCDTPLFHNKIIIKPERWKTLSDPKICTVFHSLLIFSSISSGLILRRNVNITVIEYKASNNLFRSVLSDA